MNFDDPIAYHQRELEIACDPSSPARCLPEVSASDRAILDVGCGIGQFFVGAGLLGTGRRLVGLDVVPQVLDHGRARFPEIDFTLGQAEALPFADASFDLVVARVSLNYTDLSRSLPEIARVLAPGGRLWATLHPVSRTFEECARALRQRQAGDLAVRMFVLVNGVAFHLFGRQFASPRSGKTESFQTEAGMRRALARSGLGDVGFHRGRHFVCTAAKPECA